MSMILLLVAQAAMPSAAPTGPPERISILASPCPRSTEQEVVVCGGVPAPRLPLPVEPEAGAVVRYKGEAASGDPGACAASQWGCQVGVDVFGLATAAVRLVGKAIDPNSCCDEPGQGTNIAMLGRDAVRALKKKPDKADRVAIDLDAPPPSTAGRLSP